MGQVDDDSGEEAGFGGAKEKSHPVKVGLVLDEAHDDGQDAPRDHDAGNPQACAPDLHEKAPWHLEQEITNEEDARPGAKVIFGNVEVLFHLRERVPDIDAVQDRDDVKEEKVG